jgi:hypothetical protein
MDFVTVTHVGIIFALKSYRNIVFLVRTTEFLFPAVMTYECYFLLFIHHIACSHRRVFFHANYYLSL